jgi:hypothetical protein
MPRPPRRPLTWMIWIALAGGLGLGSRRYAGHLPTMVAAYAGDTSWALALFLGLGLILPRITTGRIAALALLGSLLVEVSQLYHAPWIDSLRQTKLGGLCWAMASCGATWPATPSGSASELFSSGA